LELKSDVIIQVILENADLGISTVTFTMIERWGELLNLLQRSIKEETLAEVTKTYHRSRSYRKTDELLHSISITRHKSFPQELDNLENLVFVDDNEAEAIVNDVSLFPHYLVHTDGKTSLKIDNPLILFFSLFDLHFVRFIRFRIGLFFRLL
jgi:hypothetical protein